MRLVLVSKSPFFVLGFVLLLSISLIAGCSDSTDPTDGMVTHDGDLELGTQAEVDAALGLEDITGSLTIGGRFGNNVVDLSPLASLRRIGESLTILDCDSLQSLTGLEGVTELGGTYLYIVNNPMLVNLSALAGIEGFDGTLYMSRNVSLTSLSGLPDLSALRYLNIYFCDRLTNLDGLGALPALIKPDFDMNPLLSDISGMSDLQQMAEIIISGCPSLVSLDGLADAPVLKSIALSNNAGLERLFESRSLPQVEHINIHACPSFTALGDLTDLDLLEGLVLVDLETFTMFGESLDTPSLRYLRLRYLPAFSSFYQTPGASTLRTLTLTYCNSLIDLTTMPEFPELSYVNLTGNESLVSLDGLEYLQEVSFISLRGHPVLADISGLSNIHTITAYGSIKNNSALSTCLIEDWVAGIDFDGEIEVDGNGICD